jgi:hypothetical protein
MGFIKFFKFCAVFFFFFFFDLVCGIDRGHLDINNTFVKRFITIKIE